MSTTIKVLDVVALTEDLPQHEVYRGQVGTVVELLAPGVSRSSSATTTGTPTLRRP